MKIIQIMPEFGLAGAEIMCENLVYELAKQGENVLVVSLYNYKSAITERIEEAGIRIIYLNKRLGMDLSMIIKLYEVFKYERPDVVHTHRHVLQYVVPAAIMAGVKRRVHTVHNVANKEVGPFAQRINSFFYHFNTVTPVALSSEIQETIIKRYGLIKRNVPVIFNGINLQKCIVKDSYEIKGRISILHIGRFSEQKNHIELLKGFRRFNKQYTDSELVLIGDGERRSEIESFIIENGMETSVHLLGLQSKVYEYLNAADVFILPSLYEGVPMTLIEAMASGLPIIASNVGGIPDMLNNGTNAILIKPESKDIYKALVEMTGSMNLRKKYGEAAYLRSKYFSSEVMAKKYIEVYRL